MALVLTPDLEQLVAAYLREHPDVTALVGSRVVGQTPADTSTPWVRITVLDDIPNARSSALHLIGGLIQADCYAGKDLPVIAHEDASLLGRTVRAALHQLPGVHDQGVVTGIRVGSLTRQPDAGFTPARERFVLDAVISAHA